MIFPSLSVSFSATLVPFLITTLPFHLMSSAANNPNLTPSNDWDLNSNPSSVNIATSPVLIILTSPLTGWFSNSVSNIIPYSESVLKSAFSPIVNSCDTLFHK